MDESAQTNRKLILLTGATGYIGSSLLKKLEHEEITVRCMVRRPKALAGRTGPSTEVVQGDVFDTDSLARALKGVHTAYYLVHSLGGAGSFEVNDRRASSNFSAAARRAGVQKIIYLGGLGSSEAEKLSHHLASRQEVGAILRASGVPTIEFRASVVIGSGSLSFEMVRALVEKLPVMTTPRWVRALAQPIAIDDVVSYLFEALSLEIATNRVFEIGGGEKVSYEGIMREYARIRGLPRLIIHLPFLTPWLSSLWLAFVTPLFFRVGRRLIEGVRNETVVRDGTARQLFSVEPMGITNAISTALEKEDREFKTIRWADELSEKGHDVGHCIARFKTRYVDSRFVQVACSAERAFKPIGCIGGKNGWYSYNWLWSLRGLLDKLIGGVGFRRHRRDPESLALGDTVDFWRVDAFEENRLVRFAAEMKLPGRAWLQFEVDAENGRCRIRQTALYEPLGVSGFAYWYVLYPMHMLIFKKMLEGIAASTTERR